MNDHRINARPPRRVRSRPAAPPLGFAVLVSHPANGVTVIDPTGDLDAGTHQDFDRHVDEQLDGLRCRRLVLDLGRLTFFGARGLTCLLRARAIAVTRGTQLRLVVNTPTVTVPLDVTRLRAGFTVCSRQTDAVHGAVADR